jgi:hypothetical protein
VESTDQEPEANTTTITIVVLFILAFCGCVGVIYGASRRRGRTNQAENLDDICLESGQEEDIQGGQDSVSQDPGTPVSRYSSDGGDPQHVAI